MTRIAERDGPDTGWTITSRTRGQEQQAEFDLVVVCIGLFSHLPNMPTFPGEDSFVGKIMHNSELKSREQLAGKRVAVLGYGKSATDAALESAEPSQPRRTSS